MRTTKLLTLWLSIAVLTIAFGCSPEAKKKDAGADVPVSDIDNGEGRLDVEPLDVGDVTGPVDLKDVKEDPEVVDVKPLDETAPEDLELVEPDEIEPEKCTLSCDVNADCDGVFEDLGACYKPFCQPNEACQNDDDPDNDKQCVALKISDDCCEQDSECKDESSCTCNEKCVANVCTSDLCSPLPEECCQDIVVRKFDFNNVAIGAMPSPDLMEQNTHTTKAVKWSVQNGPCGSPALYLGDATCKTYYNGQFSPDDPCVPVTTIPCTKATEDVDCPEPAQTCDEKTSKCKADPIPQQVWVELTVPELNLPDNALVTVTFRLWMDAEEAPNFEEQTFDRLKLFADTVNGPGPLLYTTETLDDNNTQGTCLLVSADLSDYSGKSVNLRFDFNTVDGTENVFEGIYIDDLTVRTYCDTDMCNNVSECDDGNQCTVDSCIAFANLEGQGVCDNFLQDQWCIPCQETLDCQGKGPHPEDLACFPPSCNQATKTCEWPPNPSCCNAANLPGAYFENGFESGDLGILGYLVDEPPGSGGVKWHLKAGAGLDESEQDPDFDTFAVRFSNAAGDSYDCGIDQCYGSISTPKIDLTDAAPNAFVKLTFLLNLSTEWDSLPDPASYVAAGIDVLTVYAIPEGEDPVKIWTSDSIAGSTHGQALPMWADLSPYVGQKLTLKFTFDTGDVQPPNNNFAGPIVDEIQVVSVCDKVCKSAGECDGGAPCDLAQCIDGACNYNTAIPECCTKADDPACDDGNECTNDSCVVNSQKCQHTFSGDPQCCSEQAFIFTTNFEDAATFNPLQADDAENQTWTVPKLNPSCGNGICLDNESSITCPADCNQAPVSWHLATFDQFSGDNALYFGSPETQSYNDAPQKSYGVIRGPAFKMPPYGTPKVSFKLKLETEHCSSWGTFVEPQIFDILSLSLVAADSTDSNTWSSPVKVWDSMAWDVKGCTWDPVQKQAVWRTVEVNLGLAAGEAANLTGKALRFQFEFDTFDNFDNDYLGVLIDDFSVDVVCGSECFSAYDCAETDPGSPNCTIEACSQGTCTSSVNPLKEGCCVQDVLAAYDFDGPCGMDGWTAKPPSGTVKWQAHNGQSKSPTCSLYFGNPAAGNYNVPGAKVSGVATSPTIDVTDQTEVEVSYCLWLDLEDPWFWSDFYTLKMDQVLFAGQQPLGSPITLKEKPCSETEDTQCQANPVQAPCTFRGCETLLMSQWVCDTFTLDLTQYDWVPISPRLAVFQFAFDSGDDVSNMGEGLYVDDFKVKTICE